MSSDRLSVVGKGGEFSPSENEHSPSLQRPRRESFRDDSALLSDSPPVESNPALTGEH